MSGTLVKRSANFTPDEVYRLMDLVKKYKNIIENKKSDHMFLFEKVKTWKKIEEEFNSSISVEYRDAKTLKNKYENIKKTSKKKFTKGHPETYKTAKGPPVNLQLPIIDNMVNELMEEQFSGFQSTYDSDTLNSNFEQPTLAYQSEATEVLVKIEQTENTINSGPTGIPMENLKQPGTNKTTNIQPRKRKRSYLPDMCSDIWQNLAAEKIKLVKLKQMHAIERHELELQFMREKHAVELKILNKKANLEIWQEIE